MKIIITLLMITNMYSQDLILKSNSPIYLKAKILKQQIHCKKEKYIVNGIDESCKIYSTNGIKMLTDKFHAKYMKQAKSMYIKINCYYDKKNHIFKDCKLD